MESEPNFEVTDKRRVHMDDEPAQAPASGPEPADGARNPSASGGDDDVLAAPADEDTAEEMPPLDVYSLLGTTVSLLANGAWAWLGLTPSPFSGKMEKDLSQARVAIDAVGYLAGQIEGRLDDKERAEMQNMVTMLRVNYVQQSQSNT